MNQILSTKISKLLKKRTYIIQFFIIILIIIFLIIELLLNYYSKTNEKKISKIAGKSYSLSKLYQINQNRKILLNNMEVPIIGTIVVPSVNIYYPIFSKCSDELLKISVCKFYGPNLNNVGNLCIAGHNYNNGMFFSNLFYLKENDKLYIYDNNSKVYIYSIYNIYEINPLDLSCISQNTNRSKRNNSYYL